MNATNEQSRNIRLGLWNRHPMFSCENCLWECAEILHDHLALPIQSVEWELGAASELMLAGGEAGRTAKSQWLASAADGVGLIVVRIKLEQAVSRFAARLGIKLNPSLVLRAWAQIVDPSWDGKVCRPTVHTFANFLPPSAKLALKRFKNKPYGDFI